jgi:hypothetical protein
VAETSIAEFSILVLRDCKEVLQMYIHVHCYFITAVDTVYVLTLIYLVTGTIVVTGVDLHWLLLLAGLEHRKQ